MLQLAAKPGPDATSGGFKKQKRKKPDQHYLTVASNVYSDFGSSCNIDLMKARNKQHEMQPMLGWCEDVVRCAWDEHTTKVSLPCNRFMGHSEQPEQLFQLH